MILKRIMLSVRWSNSYWGLNQSELSIFKVMVRLYTNIGVGSSTRQSLSRGRAEKKLLGEYNGDSKKIFILLYILLYIVYAIFINQSIFRLQKGNSRNQLRFFVRSSFKIDSKILDSNWSNSLSMSLTTVLTTSHSKKSLIQKKLLLNLDENKTNNKVIFFFESPSYWPNSLFSALPLDRECRVREPTPIFIPNWLWPWNYLENKLTKPN